MSIEVTYASHRNEVWRWYWKAWPRRFLPVHAAIAAPVCGLSILMRGATSIEVAAARGAIVSVLLIAALIAYPQFIFKPQVRTLTVDRDGVSRRLGSSSERRSWRQISSIVDDGGYIIMETNGGAFIVPPRAFVSDVDRADFLAFVVDARAAASKVSDPG